MASLQTLRNKFGIILVVIVGIAIASFVLTDLLTSGSTIFGNNQNNVGEIDGNDISYVEYDSRIKYLTEIQQISTGGNVSNSEEETEALRNQAWESFIREYALKPAMEKAGFTVSKEEMVQLITGSYTSPIIMQMFANQETGQLDRDYLANFISNVDGDPSGRYKMFWSYLQQEVEDQSQIMKYKSVIDKGSYVTGFEVEKMANLEGNNFSVRFVANQLTAVSDSTVNVSDGEIKEFYDAHKKMFNTTSSRTIEYVSFMALPSAEDYDAASKYIEELKEEFVNSTDVVQFAKLNSQTAIDNRYYKEGELPGALGEFAFQGTANDIYGPVLEADQYTISRIADTKVIPDSIGLSQIAVLPLQKTMADSLVIELRKGANFAEAAAKHSIDPQTSQNSGEMGIIDPQTMHEMFATPILNAKKGEIVVVETPQAIHIIKITDVKGESKKVKLATVKYTIEASETTRNKAYSEANTFAGVASGDFDKQVSDKSLVKRSAVVAGADMEIQGLPKSRELVRWAFDDKTKKNEVSKVLEFGDNFVVATLKTVTEEGVAPLSDPNVKTFVKDHVIRIKKGQMLAERMKGTTSVDQLAEKLSLEVKEASEVNMSTYIVPEVGMDLAFAGGICGMDASKISKPIIGNAAVYVVQILGSESNPVAVEIQKARMQAEGQQQAFMSAYQATVKMSNIKDLRYKFY